MQQAAVRVVETQDMSMGALLREAREDMGLSQQQLADRTKIGLPSIRKYERAGEAGGQYPPTDKLFAICHVLGVNPQVLMAEVMGDGVSALGQIDKPEGMAELQQQIKLLSKTVERLVEQQGDAGRLGQQAGDVEDTDAYPLSRLESYVQQRGLKGRMIAQEIEAVEAAFSEMEYSDALELAERWGVDVTEFPDIAEIEDMETDAMANWCASLASAAILRVVYPEVTLSMLSRRGLGRVVDDINRLGRTQRGFFSDDPIKDEGLFEEKDAVMARWQRELLPHLVQALKDRKPLDLANAEKYERLS